MGVEAGGRDGDEVTGPRTSNGKTKSRKMNEWREEEGRNPRRRSELEKEGAGME